MPPLKSRSFRRIFYNLGFILLLFALQFQTSIAATADVAQPDAADGSVAAAPQKVSGGVIDALLDNFIENEDAERSGFAEISANLPAFFPDLIKSFSTISSSQSFARSFGFLIAALVLLIIALIVEKWTTKWISKKYLQAEDGETEGDENTLGIAEKIGSSVVSVIPGIMGIFVFMAISFGCYPLFFSGTTKSARVIFVALLLCIVFYRVVVIVSAILMSPANEKFRFLPFSDETARRVDRLLVWVFSYIFSVLIIAAAFARLGALPVTELIFKVLAATLLLAFMSFVAIKNRKLVADYILAPTPEHPEPPSWGRRSFAEIWHVGIILYFIGLWVLLINSTADPASSTKGAFLLSFFILPIWLILDSLLALIIRYMMSILRIYETAEHGKIFDAEVDEDLAKRKRGRKVLRRTLFYSRAVLVIVLVAWLANLWGYSVPFVAELTKAIFDSIIIMALALSVWRLISAWIERKMVEEGPEEDDKEQRDDEFGGKVAKGRAYTLLPIARKFIGLVLAVMVVLTILSSLGVNIGPLLAGAGVVGLAVGFGSQKIVADVLSGFFYLFDDAFRVGEYLKTGAASGTVESISLRNVMLRHHRGMLQIVPHSELGSITNYMRGGIIEKFNLDFPYDADIDKIRKIIKKVGIEMMNDPEFANDFIQPVKSQGVREISNSVMTIRVKYTARPGTHFVIRREAFKRITEALKARGIDYAHKKVIVDFPQGTSADKETSENIALAAGAAARQIIDEEEQGKNGGS